MAQMPPYGDDRQGDVSYHAEYVPAARTSGLAIASLVCGISSLVTCCTIIPSLLGMVFGFVALGPIRRQEARGKELAVAGIITSLIGLVLGSAVIGFVAWSPDNTPQSGVEVSESERQTLISLGVLQNGEEIDLFCPSGFFSIREAGVLLSDERLVVYQEGSQPRSTALEDIAVIDFIAGTSWIDDGLFTLQLEDGNELTFTVSSMESGDVRFERRLRKLAGDARHAAGKQPPSSGLATTSED